MFRLYPEVGGGPGRVFHRRKAYDRCEQPSSGCPLADVKADHRSEGGARHLTGISLNHWHRVRRDRVWVGAEANSVGLAKEGVR